ncbi:MAG: molybdenum cofactor guanylyltransferase [Flavobacteriales bacterium]|nr:molybdenum cofactor guanylyltransferase [Flavobacteriales bacterium]
MARNICTGIVLAGGKSSRMGTEKGLVSFKGKAMIEHAISMLETITMNIIISSNSCKYNYLSKVIVEDKVLGVGPGAGIAAALNKSSSEINIVVPCDMPHLSQYFIEYMLSKWGSKKILVPVFNGRSEPLCAIINKDVAVKMEAILDEGIYKLTTIYDIIGVDYLEITGDEPGFSDVLFNNYNSPSDLDS